jgi:hypothetical protein
MTEQKQAMEQALEAMESVPGPHCFIQPAEAAKVRASIAALRAALSSPPDVQKFGCHCDIENTISGLPDDCVFDNGDVEDCIYAVKLQREGRGKAQCNYWQPIQITPPPAASAPKEPGRTDGVALPDGAQSNG